MDIKDLICIGCPLGCALIVELNGNDVIRVTGHTCKIGENYGKKECTNPTRVLTSSVLVSGSTSKMLPVKTDGDIPKGMIQDCINVLTNVIIKAPIHIGDIIIENILNTGINIISTKNIEIDS